MHIVLRIIRIIIIYDELNILDIYIVLEIKIMLEQNCRSSVKLLIELARKNSTTKKKLAK